MTKAVVLSFIIIAIFLIYFGISFYIAKKFLTPKHIKFSETSETIGKDATDFSIRTVDNVKISGWLFKNNSDKIIIFVPGIHQNRISGEYKGFEIAKIALRKGYGVVLYDPRGTGNSTGNILGFGYTEVNDLNAVINYLVNQGYDKKNMAIIGSSLGAITTLQDLDNLRNIEAIVSDSAATKMEPLVKKGLRSENIPQIFDFGIFLISKIFFKVDITGVNPIDKVATNKDRPILFLHGNKDSVINMKNSRELLKSSGSESKLVEFKGAEHVQSFNSDPSLYENEVFTFIKNNLSKN